MAGGWLGIADDSRIGRWKRRQTAASRESAKCQFLRQASRCYRQAQLPRVIVTLSTHFGIIKGHCAPCVNNFLDAEDRSRQKGRSHWRRGVVLAKYYFTLFGALVGGLALLVVAAPSHAQSSS